MKRLNNNFNLCEKRFFPDKILPLHKINIDVSGPFSLSRESINIHPRVDKRFVFKSISSRFLRGNRELGFGLSNSVRFPSREMATAIFLLPFCLSFFLWRSSFGSRNRNDDLERSLRAVVVALLLRNFIKSSHDWVKKKEDVERGEAF